MEAPPSLDEGLQLLDKYKHRQLTTVEAHALLRWLDQMFMQNPRATGQDRGWAAVVRAGVWAVLIDQQVEAVREQQETP